MDDHGKFWRFWEVCYGASRNGFGVARGSLFFFMFGSLRIILFFFGGYRFLMNSFHDALFFFFCEGNLVFALDVSRHYSSAFAGRYRYFFEPRSERTWFFLGETWGGSARREDLYS